MPTTSIQQKELKFIISTNLCFRDLSNGTQYLALPGSGYRLGNKCFSLPDANYEGWREKPFSWGTLRGRPWTCLDMPQPVVHSDQPPVFREQVGCGPQSPWLSTYWIALCCLAKWRLFCLLCSCYPLAPAILLSSVAG